MRLLSPVGAAALAVAATVLLAPVSSAQGNPPGDNGTIKIHDSVTGEELVQNEPHVCTFYLDAFFFDGRQQAAWQIVEQPPTATAKDQLASSGAIPLDATGHGRTGDMTLPDGHYKLEWNFDGEHGQAKQKVFWVTCPSQGGSTSGGSTTGGSTGGSTTGGSTGGSTNGGSTSGGSTTGGSTGGSTTGGSTGGSTGGTTTGGSTGGSTSGSTGSTTGTPSGTPTPSGKPTPSHKPSHNPSPTAAGTPSGGNLADTGASVLGIGGAAVALLTAGGALLFFRRRGGRQQH